MTSVKKASKGFRSRLSSMISHRRSSDIETVDEAQNHKHVVNDGSAGIDINHAALPPPNRRVSCLLTTYENSGMDDIPLNAITPRGGAYSVRISSFYRYETADTLFTQGECDINISRTVSYSFANYGNTGLTSR